MTMVATDNIEVTAMPYQPVIHEKICKTVDEFCINLPGHNVRPIKVVPGDFNAYYLLAESRDFSLMIRQVEYQFHEAGVINENSLGTGFILNGDNINYNGKTYLPEHRLITSGTSLNAVLPSNLRLLTCFIDKNKLPEFFIQEELEQFHQACDLEVTQGPLKSKSSYLKDFAYESLSGFSSGAIQISNEEELTDFTETLYQQVFEFVTENLDITSSNQRVYSRSHILDKCLGYIHDSDNKNIRVSDLSKHVDTTQRNLQKVFLQSLGVTPKSYLTSYKMNIIHSALLEADPIQNSVSNISKQYGINHQGNFAKAYFEFYGEYPNQTLNRSEASNIYFRHTGKTIKDNGDAN